MNNTQTKGGEAVSFAGCDWLTLEVQKGKTLLVSKHVLEKRSESQNAKHAKQKKESNNLIKIIKSTIFFIKLLFLKILGFLGTIVRIINVAFKELLGFINEILRIVYFVVLGFSLFVKSYCIGFAESTKKLLQAASEYANRDGQENLTHKS